MQRCKKSIEWKLLIEVEGKCVQMSFLDYTIFITPRPKSMLSLQFVNKIC